MTQPLGLSRCIEAYVLYPTHLSMFQPAESKDRRAAVEPQLPVLLLSERSTDEVSSIAR